MDELEEHIIILKKRIEIKDELIEALREHLKVKDELIEFYKNKK